MSSKITFTSTRLDSLSPILMSFTAGKSVCLKIVFLGMSSNLIGGWLWLFIRVNGMKAHAESCRQFVDATNVHKTSSNYLFSSLCSSRAKFYTRGPKVFLFPPQNFIPPSVLLSAFLLVSPHLSFPSDFSPCPLFDRSAEGDSLTMPLSQSLSVSSTNRPR